ncbi:hypothetical protein [Actinomadura kijaniata]|uniref:hypothetical protein n=1 Tax=Actinomadura kijaniata TaxID=46161 RepID=UPI00082AF99E|nr:hypothetical protein [Actinomadura kijaniata]
MEATTVSAAALADSPGAISSASSSLTRVGSPPPLRGTDAHTSSPLGSPADRTILVEGLGEWREVNQTDRKLDGGEVVLGSVGGLLGDGEQFGDGEHVAGEAAPGRDAVSGDAALVDGLFAYFERAADLVKELVPVYMCAVLGGVQVQQVQTGPS